MGFSARESRMRPTKSSKKTLGTIVKRVLLPTVVGGGVLVALILIANPQQALHLITNFQPGYLVGFFLLMAAYEVVRCAQWHYLLRRLRLRVPLQTQIFAYGIGEFTKNVPIGNFVPDYVLTREQGTDFGRASSSSLLVSVLEVAVALAGLVIIGVDDWMWVRPVILGGSFVFVLFAWAFYRWRHSPHAGQPGHPHHAPAWSQRILRWRWVQGGLHELHEFSQGETTLLHPGVIAVSTLACVAYMVFSGLALFAVVRGLGLSGVTWDEALAASFLSLAFSTIIPVPTDLGSSEASGAAALVATGLTATGAISTLLLYRFLNLVEQVLVALLAILVFPGEFRALWRAHPWETAP